MRSLSITRAARLDLKKIAAHTQKTWGITQRRIYLLTAAKIIAPAPTTFEMAMMSGIALLLCCLTLELSRR